jgi:signal transduction histidine kinase
MMQDKIDVLNSKVELEHLNHKLQIVLDAAFVTPWTIDLKKQTVIVLGKEYQIEDIRKRVHPDDIRDYNDCIESLISNHDKQGIEPHNIRINFNGHRFHWYKMRCIVDSFDNQGNPAILIGSAEDIDKQKQIEDNLIEAKEKAEESNKLKSAFIANMSHEIRTPLNAIIGFSEVLSVSQTLSEEEKVLFRKNIATNKDLLMQLFSDILDLAKIDAGTIEFNYVEEDFTSIIKSVATSARLRENSNKDVKLVIEDVPDSCILFTDPHRVTQVITNFVNNAIKFTLAGTISIGYSITEDNMIYCHVTDTGIGIPKEHQPKIFERFVKLNSFKQGTGLGLSICKMIIEKMNGQIGVVSEQDKGSTFWFKIPILKEAPLMEENG